MAGLLVCLSEFGEPFVVGSYKVKGALGRLSNLEFTEVDVYGVTIKVFRRAFLAFRLG